MEDQKAKLDPLRAISARFSGASAFALTVVEPARQPCHISLDAHGSFAARCAQHGAPSLGFPRSRSSSWHRVLLPPWLTMLKLNWWAVIKLFRSRVSVMLTSSFRAELETARDLASRGEFAGGILS